MGSSSKKSGPEVFDFLMSIDYGLCHGPLDSLNQIWVKDKPIWCGTETARIDVGVDLPDLFGGDKMEGGVVGTVEYYPGGFSQTVSDALANRMELTSQTAPGYRGLAHLFFRGKADGLGFRWSTNNPYLPEMKASATRLPKSIPVPGTNYEIRRPGVTESGELTIDMSCGGGGGAPAPPPGGGWTLMAECPNPISGPAGYLVADLGSGSELDTPNQNTINYTNGCLSGQADQTLHSFSEPVSAQSGHLIYMARYLDEGLTEITGSPVYFQQQTHYYYRPGGVEYTEEPFVLDIDYAECHCKPDQDLGILPDANPAQIIYECLVNTDWGKGEDPAMIDAQSFATAANTLAVEYFGLSMGWFAQDTIENFVQEVLDHIQAFLFQDPRTALWTLRLLRDDYDVLQAQHIDEKNAGLHNSSRKAWGETINEIVVSYTDPTTEKEATVSSHNLGNIAVNGGIISETRNYYGIRNPILAKVVADRDVESAGYPVFTAQARVDRTFWATRPGDVVTLSWTDEGLLNAVMRVVGVNYGSPSDRTIVLDLSEDIFALGQTSYAGSQVPLLPSDTRAATPLDVQMAVTAPLPGMTRNGFTVADVDEGNPGVYGLLMADDIPRPRSIQVHAQVTRANGSTVVESIAQIPPTRSILLATPLIPETVSRLPDGVVQSVTAGNPEPGELLMLGIGESGSELVMLDSFVAVDSEWVVVRGAWDTVPTDWPIGSRIWAFPSSALRADPTERAAGDTITYRLLPKTGFNTLDYADATDLVKTYTDRPFAPFRPANCQLGGNPVFVGANYGGNPPASITATWSNRNRTNEDSIINAWDEGTATPETGQTTVLQFYDDAGVLSHEITGLTGTSHEIPLAGFAPLERGYIKFLSERDGYRSLWGSTLTFNIAPAGYGLNYGFQYGGVS